MTHDNKEALDALQEIQTIVEMYVRGSEWPNTFAKLRAALQRPAVPDGFTVVITDLPDDLIIEAVGIHSDDTVTQEHCDEVRNWHKTIISLSQNYLPAAPKDGEV